MSKVWLVLVSQSKNGSAFSVPRLAQDRQDNGKDHKLASSLWKTGIAEARILASMICGAEALTEKQMDDSGYG